MNNGLFEWFVLALIGTLKSDLLSQSQGVRNSRNHIDDSDVILESGITNLLNIPVSLFGNKNKN